MVKDNKTSLFILGVVSVIAVIGLVMMFSTNTIHGAEFTNIKPCDSPCTMVVGYEEHLDNWLNAGFTYKGDTEFTYIDGTKTIVPCVCPPQGV